MITYGTNTVLLSIGVVGDLNGDGYVGAEDLQIILVNWNLWVPPGDPRGDVGGVGGSGPDGYIGADDLNVVLTNWNNGTLPPAEASAVVPEPSTFLLLAAGGAGLLRRCKPGRLVGTTSNG